jgi:hypothetical protein
MFVDKTRSPSTNLSGTPAETKDNESLVSSPIPNFGLNLISNTDVKQLGHGDQSSEE